MWSKLVSWILAVITAIFNGFGFYQKEYVPYIGDPAYEVQEEAVDYAQMRTWYIDSYVGSGDVCTVERHSNPIGELNNLGFCFFIAGVDNNPDAKNEVSEGAIIIAPARCKVMSNPDTSSDRIVVQNDSGDYTAFKMEIYKPGSWFCCQNTNKTPTGAYMHSVVDHKIELNQGDTICVAGPDTTIRMWTSNENGVLKEVQTIREFLKYDMTEKGDSEQIASGGTEKKVESDLDKILWQGNMTWNRDSTHSVSKDGVTYPGWWIGTSGDGNWAKGQTVSYKGQYYYMDTDGYMVRGWQIIGDNQYYFYWGDQDTEGMHPDGSIARNTIVENPYGSGFVYVGDSGTISETSNLDDMITVNGRTFIKEGNGSYALLHSSNASVSGNNLGTSNNSTWVGQYGISEEDWSMITSGGYANVKDGWYRNDGDWIYVVNGISITSGLGTPYGDYVGYDISGVTYLFDTSSCLLYTETGIVSGQNSLYFNDGQNGIAKNKWCKTDSWHFADSTGALWSRSRGVKEDYDSAGNVLYYCFNDDCTLDAVTDSIEVNGTTYKLRGDIEGARIVVY